MEIVSLAQGSPEWLAHRAKHFNASDAPAMLGVSPHKTRRQLLAECSTGITPEVDAATQRRFNNGHRLEALARPLAEQIIGEPLYPVTGTNGRYSASFDGLTLGGETAFEHKALNADLRGVFDRGEELPLHYRAQIEHQLLVSGAGGVLFMASDWDADGNLVEERHCWVATDPELRERLVAGWERFAADLAAFEPTPAAEPAPIGTAPETLPALRIEVEGTVIASNLVAFRETAIAAVRAVKRELQTDQDFADAELSVKWCREVESRIEAAKAHALAQTATIDELFRALDAITDESRRVRLDLEKRVKNRKDEIRASIVTDAQRALGKHIGILNGELAPFRIAAVEADFAAAVKGKRSITAMHDAVDSVLADARIRAESMARTVRENGALYRDRAAGLDAIFPDIAAHIGKPTADFAEWLAIRIEAHRLAMEKREAAARHQAAEESAARERIQRIEPVAQSSPGNYDEMREAFDAFRAANGAAVEAETGTPEDPDQPATLSLGEINARLGLTMSAAFVAALGITPAGRARRAILFTESQFAAICRGLIAHVTAVRTRHGVGREPRGMEVANGRG